MADNLEIWNTLGRTDPAHTKGFKRGGGFSGTAVKPIYTEQKMTEVFGPAGKGWGMGEPTFQTVQGSEGQVAVYCTVSLWWIGPDDPDGTENTVYGVGGDMVVIKQSNGLRTDDEAFKKAFTDAVGNAMKHLGMSADVHMGRFDDSKYVNEVRAELAEERAPEKRQTHKEKTGQTIEETRPIWKEMADEIAACQTVEELFALWSGDAFKAEYKKLPDSWKDEINTVKEARKEELAALAA